MADEALTLRDGLPDEVWCQSHQTYGCSRGRCVRTWAAAVLRAEKVSSPSADDAERLKTERDFWRNVALKLEGDTDGQTRLRTADYWRERARKAEDALLRISNIAEQDSATKVSSK